MKKSVLITAGIAIALTLLYEGWILRMILKNRERIEAVEAHVKAAHDGALKTKWINADSASSYKITLPDKGGDTAGQILVTESE